MLAKRLEETAGNTGAEGHLAAHRSHKGDAVLNLYVVGTAGLLDVGNHIVQTVAQSGGGGDKGKAVKPQGDMLNGSVVSVQNLQRLAQGHAGVHIPLQYGENGEVPPPGNAGDEALNRLLLLNAVHNHGARILRPVGVSDVQGNALFLHRQDGFLMENRRTHEGQLPQLRVGDMGNGAGIGNNLGISHQYAGDIGPVFIHIGVNRGGAQRAGNVAAAPGHHLDLTGGQTAVKAGDQDLPVGLQRGGNGAVGLFPVDLPVKAEENAACRVHKFVAQIFRHKLCGKVFAPGDQFIHGHIPVQAGAEGVKLALHVIVQAQLVSDIHKALPYSTQYIRAGHAVCQVCVTEIQKICQLVVVPVPLSGCRDHNQPP